MGTDLSYALGGSILLGELSQHSHQVADDQHNTARSVFRRVRQLLGDVENVALHNYSVMLKTSGTVKVFVHRP